ncbi:MAG TPA: DUF3052 domain-containing protein, partial [Candidatus Dormibacteraeota bacterium]|nr:DUF3052 domain-containing protein [Candidatus Dormibacteraeota bacterium]
MTKPLLDKLGVKLGARVALVDIDDASFLKMLRERTSDIVTGKPRMPCDIVFVGAKDGGDLARLAQIKAWIEPNGAIWVIRQKGPGSPLRDTDLIEAGLAAGLVDNKIASFSETHGA